MAPVSGSKWEVERQRHLDSDKKYLGQVNQTGHTIAKWGEPGKQKKDFN